MADKSIHRDRINVFRGVDLNLFVVFSTLYAERGTTKAAEVLGITQSAVSHSLSRLRNALGDQLFVRRGATMNPTPFAKMIIDDVHNALDCLSSGPLGLNAFDPMSSNREFKISTTPGIEIFLLPQLLKVLSTQAPNVRVTSDHLSRSLVENRLMRGDLDFAVSMDPPMAPEIRRRLLREDSLVTIARVDNPLLERGFSKETYLRAKHVAISSRQSGGGLEEIECIRHGVKREIVARCGTISSAIKTVEVTDYLLTLGRLKLEIYGMMPNLKVFDFPFRTDQALEGYLLWHESEEDDPANQWLREKITELLKRPIASSIKVMGG